MIRTILQDNRICFGPLQDSQINMIRHDPMFEGHGICAMAHPGQVEVYVTLPSEKAAKVKDWFLRNHKVLA